MAELIGIVGRSGTGKSTSIEGLDPKDSFILSVSGKALPFKGWKKNYTPLDMKTGKTGNYYKTSNPKSIIQTMNLINKDRTEIKNLVLDDYQYIMAFEFFNRASEKGYEKFNEIGKSGADPIIKGTPLRDDLKIFVLTHEEEISENFKPLRKMKTIGKMIDEKLTMEGLFTVVLFTEVEKDDKNNITYSFITNSDGSTTAKSPKGMFKDFKIPNDLGIVSKAIADFYGE